MSKDPRGNSSVQQRAEVAMRTLLQAEHGLLAELNWKIDDDVEVQIDAVNSDRSVLIEIFARQGNLLDGQKKKIAKDILKLALIGIGDAPKKRRLILAHANPAISKHVTHESWLSRATAKFGIEEICLFDKLPEELKAEIRETQKTQGERFK